MSTPTDWITQVAHWSRIDQVLACADVADAVRPCASHEGRHWQRGEMDALVNRAATALLRAGVIAGDRIALLSTPRPEYLLLLMAASRIGAIYVGLNPRYTAHEIAEVVNQVRPRLLVSMRVFEGRDFIAVLNDAARLCPMPPMAFFMAIEECVNALDALQAPLPAALPSPDLATQAALPSVAAIVFTSGTTGRPKAAMLTHRGLLHAAAVQHERLNPAEPRYLCHLPVNHVGCLMNLTLGALVARGSVVFLERFSAARTLQLIREERVTCWLQVPAMYHECTRDPAFDPSTLSHLHSICIGGGAASISTIRHLRKISAPLYVEYGQTETSSSAAYSDAGADDEILVNCVGKFDPRFEFRIAGIDDQPLGAGDVGEVQGRGALIFAGYFGDPAATAAAFTPDGWLRTGDLAYAREDGNVVLRGRLKEMIKTGGYNVYPREVELVLERHPDLGQVVVVGLPDERYGEAVHAVVSARSLVPGEEALTALCREHLANYKVPKSFRLIEAFPLLSNGKIDRVRTRNIAAHLPLLTS